MTGRVTPIDRNKRLHHVIETRLRAQGRVYDPPLGEVGFDEDHVVTDGNGRVLAMPDVPIRECYGDGVTYLLHGNHGICLTCPIRSACLGLVNERVATDEQCLRLMLRYASRIVHLREVAPKLTDPDWGAFVQRWGERRWAYGDANKIA